MRVHIVEENNEKRIDGEKQQLRLVLEMRTSRNIEP